MAWTWTRCQSGRSIGENLFIRRETGLRNGERLKNSADGAKVRQRPRFCNLHTGLHIRGRVSTLCLLFVYGPLSLC